MAASTSVTALTCAPATVAVGAPTACTATVSAASGSAGAPTGTVSFGRNSSGAFSAASCPLVPATTPGVASCGVSYVPALAESGVHKIYAAYAGDFDTSHASTTVDVTGGPVRQSATSTSVSCSGTFYRAGSFLTCNAIVRDISASPTTPTGVVSFPTGGVTCVLAPAGTPGAASCSAQHGLGKEGPLIIWASYGGDPTHTRSDGHTPTMYIGTAAPSLVGSCAGPAKVGKPEVCTFTAGQPADLGPPTGIVPVAIRYGGYLFPPGSPTECDLTPTGAPGVSSCAVTFILTTNERLVLDATYTTFYGTGRSRVVIYPSGDQMELTCSPATVRVGSTTICSLTFTANLGSNSSVTFARNSSGSFSATSCVLAPTSELFRFSCSVTYTPGAVGTGQHVVYANFLGRLYHRSAYVTVLR